MTTEVPNAAMKRAVSKGRNKVSVPVLDPSTCGSCLLRSRQSAEATVVKSILPAPLLTLENGGLDRCAALQLRTKAECQLWMVNLSSVSHVSPGASHFTLS